MSHTFFWPGKYYFYPIGNTSAVCLTRDIPPEEHANILLLGCGDPRHVLYTIFSESKPSFRKLDFTCVDFEPAVLARNILIFTLIVDKVPTSTIWNICYHMYLDAQSHSALVAQCKKLIDVSPTSAAWRASPYSAFLRTSTEYTLTELRRHWSLYASMAELPPRRQQAIRRAFEGAFKERDSNMTPMTSARSAGPLIIEAVSVGADQVHKYWKTGTTFSGPKDVSSAKLMNPTFAYSLTGEGCSVHYGTDPMTSFHFAALFGNAKGEITPAGMVRSAKTEFSDWCGAFQRFVSDAETTPCIRFFLAEATAACHALNSFRTTESLALGIPVAQFRTQPIRLDSEEYLVSRAAPTSFNVIETSNLIDHLGLLNILVSAVPLLSPSTSGVIYTESLLFSGEDATKELAELLYADIGTMALLLNLCPIDYLSGFSTRSNTHEIMMYQFVTKKTSDKTSTQFHQVTTWKSPSSCDSVLALHGARPRLPPVFHADQIGALLFDVYHAMFEQEDSMTFWRQNQHNLLRALLSSNMIHYMRESFALFLKLVRERLRITPEEWSRIMSRFVDLETADQTMPMNTVNRNDFHAHLHRQGVYTVDHFKHAGAQKIGRFAGWGIIPPVVRIVLTVPREKIRSFETILEQTGVGTPLLHGDIRGSWSLNNFAAVHVAYGRVIPIGTQGSPRIRFEEDPNGRNGSYDLVVSFIVPSMLLTDIEPPHLLKVRLSVRSTTGTAPLHAKMGMDLEIYSANLMDEQHVQVLPEQQVPCVDIEASAGSIFPPDSTLQAEVGRQGAVSVELDEQCELVNSLTARIDLEDTDVVREFGAGAVPKISQQSPCIMRLAVAGHVQDVVFPFPVIGSENKLRLARKSRYIEVVVPMAGPFLKPDGMKLNPFPVVGSGRALLPWNVHRLSLSRLPTLDLKSPKLDTWLNPHVGSMLSDRERKMRKKHKADALLFVKDTMHAIFVRVSGIQGGGCMRVVSLRDERTNNCDTLFFIGNLRFDLHSHTVICDAYVLPLTNDIMPEISSFFGRLLNSGTMVDVRVFDGEMEAWKQLIPAFVERCRTWEHTDNCEYLARQEVPLTQKMEADPLCSCGRGKDVDGLLKVAEWRRYAPFVTRIALSPLFAVSYLETVGRDPSAHKCSVCRGRGKPKMMTCSKCQKARYCSAACQRKDWPRHKPKCKA
ncbi:hypothetical protein L226DRAFT_576582 [Lentinus tigrinus ALCF2SS1-7]|uniref:uncharacterized protein n=1 Tax=Lentinus tigrinus ALCF2SS1-7 TaxID=1328758 RepID=UPI001165CD7A|nr:hypothetical protein L226DRAFT_576582 [Lentinus tigrinus ALCF2SS1-7]